MLVATCRAAGDATRALGTFWRGALGVMQTLVAAMNHHRLKPSVDMTSDVKGWEQLFHIRIRVFSFCRLEEPEPVKHDG